MSKKTKRLEKENLTLTKKHDLTNRNIIEMAEEREKNKHTIDALKKKNDTLNNIIKQMQQQGRGGPEGTAGLVDVNSDNEAEGDTESEYEYDDEEGDEDGLNEGEYDEDTEEDNPQAPKPYGPAPPPPPAAVNGISSTNGASH